MQRTTLSLLLLQLVRYGFAIPQAAPAPSCARFSSALGCLASDSADANGTPFCSSYLSIPVRTTTSTTTVSPVPVTKTITKTSTDTLPTQTVTRVITSRVTIFPSTSTVTVNSTVTEQQTATEYSSMAFTCASTGGTLTSYTLDVGPTPVQVNKRQSEAPPSVPTPSCLTNKPTGTISKICSCLSITPSTSTATATRSITKTATVTVTNSVTVTQSPKTTVTTSKTVTVRMVSTTTETDTTTETNTVTETIVQPTPVFSGLAFFASNNAYDFGSATPGETVESVKNADNFATGALPNINDVDTYNYPGSTQCQLPAGEGPYYDCTHLSLALNGFFYAAQAGDYIFNEDANTVDNYLAFFSGDVAYSDYDDSNADFYAIRAGGGPYQGGSTTLTLAEGEYVPVQFVYFNGGGPGNIGLSITTPDGTYVTDTSNYFIFPCDNSPFVPSQSSQ